MAKKLTPFGKRVKKKLLDLGVSQREFCEEYGIPENRFSEILYGTVLGKKYRERVAQALGIKVSA